jgi:hypothetical protein
LVEGQNGGSDKGKPKWHRNVPAALANHVANARDSHDKARVQLIYNDDKDTCKSSGFETIGQFKIVIETIDKTMVA